MRCFCVVFVGVAADSVKVRELPDGEIYRGEGGFFKLGAFEVIGKFLRG